MKLFRGGGHVLLTSSPVVCAAVTRHIAASAPGGRADKHGFSQVKMSSKPSGDRKWRQDVMSTVTGRQENVQPYDKAHYSCMESTDVWNAWIHMIVLIFIANTNMLSTVLST
jgi:hypothetical protein